MRKRFIVGERNLMKFNKVQSPASEKEVLPEKIWARYGLSGEQLSWEGPDETWAKCEPTLCRSSSDPFLQSADLLLEPDGRLREVIISLYVMFIRPHLEHHMQLWVPQFKKRKRLIEFSTPPTCSGTEVFTLWRETEDERLDMGQQCALAEASVWHRVIFKFQTAWRTAVWWTLKQQRAALLAYVTLNTKN